MTDTNQLPDDVCSLKQLLLQRDATLKAVRAAMRGAQLHLDQLALLLEQSPQVQLPAEARALFQGKPLPPSRSMRYIACGR